MSIDVEALQQNPQARWTVVQFPAALPGDCLLCHGSPDNRDWFVDVGFSMDWYGAVYLCCDCIIEITNIVGFLTPDQATQIKTERDSLVQENFDLLRKLAELVEVDRIINGVVESRLRATLVGRSDSHSDPVDSQTNEPRSSSDAEFDGGSEAGPPFGSNDLAQGARASDEPSDDEGVDDLHSNGGDDGSFKLNI